VSVSHVLATKNHEMPHQLIKFENIWKQKSEQSESDTKLLMNNEAYGECSWKRDAFWGIPKRKK